MRQVKIGAAMASDTQAPMRVPLPPTSAARNSLSGAVTGARLLPMRVIGPLPVPKDPQVSKHKFRVCHNVYFQSGKIGMPAPSSRYTILRQLRLEGGERKYRIQDRIQSSSKGSLARARSSAGEAPDALLVRRSSFLEDQQMPAHQGCSIVLAMAMLLVVAQTSAAQSPPPDALPENAHAGQSGNGRSWICDWGGSAARTRRANGSCCRATRTSSTIFLAPHGNASADTAKNRTVAFPYRFPTMPIIPGRPSATRGECDYGFRKTGKACEPIVVPANAYLMDQGSGSGWKCNRGFRPATKAVCHSKSPAHAYLSDAEPDRGWRRERGFRATGQKCVEIELPPNALLMRFLFSAPAGNVSAAMNSASVRCDGAAATAAANDVRQAKRLRCDRSASPQDCVPVSHPGLIAISTSSGQSWRCERGFRRVLAACIAVVVPENAHIDYSGADWACNPPYVKKNEACSTDVSRTVEMLVD